MIMILTSSFSKFQDDQQVFKVIENSFEIK